MDMPDELLCVFSAHVDEQRGSYVIEAPKRELAIGEVQQGEVYRVALFSVETASAGKQKPGHKQDVSDPPVEEGEQRTVEIEDIGEHGDGIARVERGYVIIVPDTEMGDRVTIKITDVKPNVAFGDVVDREAESQ